MKKYLFFICFVFVVLNLSAQKEHIVQKGETLSQIAKDNGISLQQLIEANHFSDDKIKIGQKLTIPTRIRTSNAPSQKHTIKKGETLYNIAKQYKTSVEAIVQANNLENNILKTGNTLIIPIEEKQNTASSKKDADGFEIIDLTHQKKATPAQEKKEQVKAPLPTVSKTTQKKATPKTTLNKKIIITPQGSAFQELYKVGNIEKQMDGRAKRFTSKTGWSDKQYFIMINNIEKGNVVKIKHQHSSIYAKVLWHLEDNNTNKDIICRISNAAAKALGIEEGEESFTLQIFYSE